MRYDAEFHQVADTLQHDNPGWVIMWATWRRKFCAFSREPLTASLVVEATTQEKLIALLRQVEAELRRTL
ncbi:hypothetical protein Sme01_62120 [Sphaerisporangium melleum]|uniref:Uncharacterized protein n=1 Tax=Sphaerisporangium melleum TaxID=321316 RepID=A0A917VLX1_9ACTN|nr:hypothetical protein [Sphaerisporangium melleum]GGK98387.1 hypothetical protein GCM10007964_45740 [Sphaerisporangium melleum]GII73736.1 hypothetical protein Sme01_62120 [Sphaerisporangium melleum]